MTLKEQLAAIEKTPEGVFMPNDLCARCDEYEPKKEFITTFYTVFGLQKLAFCSWYCKERFVQGVEAAKYMTFEV